MAKIIILLAILLASAQSIFSTRDGLLRNGNFEAGPKSSDMKGTKVLGRFAVPDWETSGFVEYIKAGQKQQDMNLVVPEGASAVRLGNEASIKQTVHIIPKLYYSLTFSAARTCAQQEKINVSASPEFGIIPIQTLYSANGWDSYAWAFQAKSSTVDIALHNPGTEEDPACGPLIDAIAIRALPPPRVTPVNMLRNGGFEEGPYVIENATWGILIPPFVEDDHSALPGWTVASAKAVKYIDSAHFSVPQGRRAVELVAGLESAILQVASTVKGRSYGLEFAVGDARNTCQGSMVVVASAGDESLKVPYVSNGRGGFKRAIIEFVATSDRTPIMFYSSYYAFRTDDNASLCGPVVDDVKLVALP